jgi:hypothetical protein
MENEVLLMIMFTLYGLVTIGMVVMSLFLYRDYIEFKKINERYNTTNQSVTQS